MTSDPAHVRDIFLTALEKEEGAARAAFLTEACGTDEEVRRQVEILLQAHQQTGRFLEQGALAPPQTVDQPIQERPGTRIGPYKLLEEIGEGGMGVVYLAEQTEPVERRVALKIIKPGMDSRQVIARFEAERQALALMDHPNIAKVLDAGTTSAGRPYFVMELVNGIPVTQFCDEQHLTARERLELFIPICHAVQHAHQKGIIHRDLKPSNILIALYDGRPVPKVIDFGVAKAVSQRLTDKTMFTSLGQIVGTLEYMSPEQAQRNQLDIDTRSDIYSMGVVLYELLTGDTPFDKKRLRSAALDELLRIIREEEPPRPSTKLSNSDTLPSVAANRKVEPARLSKLIRGELDWIVMKTLEKDRARRYETATALAADLERFLQDEPVVACPPSATYRLRKFARRNKRTLATTLLLGLVTVTALAAVAATIGWSIRDRNARQAAVEQEALLAVQDTERLLDQEKIEDALSAAKRAQGILAGSDGTELQQRLEDLRRDIEFAVQLDSIRLQRVVTNTGTDSDPRTESTYSKAFREYGIDVDSLPMQVAAERISSSRIRDALVSGLDDWLVVGSWQANEDPWKSRLALVQAVDPDPWRNRIRQTLDSGNRKTILDELVHPDNAVFLTPRNVWPLVHSPTIYDAPEQVVSILRTAWRQAPDDFWVNCGLAYSLHHLEPPQWDESLRYYTAALVIRPDSDAVLNNLGVCLSKLGRNDEALTFYRRAVEIVPETFEAYLSLGVHFARQGAFDEAERYVRVAMRNKPQSAKGHRLLGRILADQGKPEEALNRFLAALAINPSDAETDANLRQTLTVLGRLDEVNGLYTRLTPETALSRAQLAELLEKHGMIDEAIHWYRRSIELKSDRWGRHFALGNLLLKQKRLDEAAASFREAIRLEPSQPWPHFCLGNVLREQARFDSAEASFRVAIKIDPSLWAPHFCLGGVLRELGRLDEAEQCQRTAIELNPTASGPHWELARLLHAQGREDEATDSYLKILEVDPNHAHAHFLLGNIRRKQGQLEQALDHYRKALELKPETPEFEAAMRDLEGSGVH